MELQNLAKKWEENGIKSITTFGDALAPAAIAHAVHAGRLYAEELEAPPLNDGELPFEREVTGLAQVHGSSSSLSGAARRGRAVSKR